MRRCLLLMLLSCLLITACGQKGPLFLPDEDEEQSIAPAAQDQRIT
ncbi:lipoprotein [Methylonatrum kenyense]|nr:lipoprotein [Methylonatrum kenyense]MCK8515292.1 lipoprotein [Methylonatrum kenyense]